jgi:uncharacterized protein
MSRRGHRGWNDPLIGNIPSGGGWIDMGGNSGSSGWGGGGSDFGGFGGGSFGGGSFGGGGASGGW